MPIPAGAARGCRRHGCLDCTEHWACPRAATYAPMLLVRRGVGKCSAKLPWQTLRKLRPVAPTLQGPGRRLPCPGCEARFLQFLDPDSVRRHKPQTRKQALGPGIALIDLPPPTASIRYMEQTQLPPTPPPASSPVPNTHGPADTQSPPAFPRNYAVQPHPPSSRLT